MNLLGAGRRLLGFDHGGDRYQYVDDPVRGPIHASRAADRWVGTTTGKATGESGTPTGAKPCGRQPAAGRGPGSDGARAREARTEGAVARL